MWCSCSDHRDPGGAKYTGKPAAMGTEDMVLVESFWRLTFKGPPWLVLLCCSVQQAINGPSSLGSFPISQLLAASMWRERLSCWLHPLCVTQQWHPASMAAWLSSKDIPHCYLLPLVPWAVSLQSATVLTLGFLSNRYAPAPSYTFWWTCVPVHGMQGHGMGWLCGSHSTQTVPDQLLYPLKASNAFSLSQLIAHWGSLPCCSSHGCRLSSPTLLLFSPSFILPSFVCIRIFLSGGQRLLPALSWCSVRSSVFEDIFLLHPWRKMSFMSTYTPTSCLSPVFLTFALCWYCFSWCKSSIWQGGVCWQGFWFVFSLHMSAFQLNVGSASLVPSDSTLWKIMADWPTYSL